MGGAMARRLATAGHELTLWNRTRSRAEALGVGRVAATPAEAASHAEAVISVLTDANAVQAGHLGDDRAATVANGKGFVEVSTAGPEIAEEPAPLIDRASGSFFE